MADLSDKQRIEKIILSTGNVNKPYIVRDIIFATEKIEKDLFQPDVNPNELLQPINYKLKEQAYSYGASAVINCHFELRHLEESGNTILEIFAYGTVVQYTQSTVGG